MAARLTAFIVVAIVAVTVIAGLIVGAQRDDNSGPVDLIVYNANVFPADGTAPFEGAVAVRGNTILRAGPSREVRRLRRAQTIEIDARGGTLLPGFNDAHVHLVSGGLAMERVNLLEATTLDAIKAAIRDFAAANPDKPWVMGRGWYYGPFPGGLPTKELLDELVPDRPAYMTAYDGHTSWVNSKALEVAGVTRKTPNPPNGIVVKDPKTGEPTGVLKEAAQGLVSQHHPKTTRADRARAIRSGIREAHRLGITSIQNASGSADEFEIYEELRRAGELSLRVYSAISRGGELTDEDLATLDLLRQRYADDPVFKTGAIKLMVDGVIEAHTAAMLAPYANRPGVQGEPMIAPDRLNRVVASLDARGWQLMIHAIGDAGIRQALDAYEHASRVNPAPARGRRHRIEHIETTDPADIPRFGALGVIASMQPFHANPSPNQIDVWSANIGPDRASRGWVYASISKAGGRLALGSDWPVVTLDPRMGVNMAVNRTTPEGTPAGGWYPQERMPLARVLEAYTSGAAWASFDEQRKGKIAPGMLADLVVLSKDLFDLPAAKILDAVVAYTIFDGKVVYERPAGGGSAN
jgi:predicted amidohydrolase YtcJ